MTLSKPPFEIGAGSQTSAREYGVRGVGGTQKCDMYLCDPILHRFSIARIRYSASSSVLTA